MRKKLININSRAKEALTGILFTMPSFLGQLIFFFIPFGLVIYYSMLKNPITKEFVGIKNYIDITSNVVFIRAIKNTLIFTSVSVLSIIVLSTLLALLLSKKMYFRNILQSCFLIPLIVPTVSVIMIWQSFFDFNGTLNSAIALFGFSKVDWLNSEYARWIIVLFYIWKNVGYSMILILAAIQNIPTELYEAAEIDGANKMKKFKHITLPGLVSTLFFTTIIAITNSFKIFREIYLLSGDYPHESLYMLQHYINNLFGVLDYQKLSVSAVYMALFVIFIVGFWALIEKKFD